MKTKLYTAIFLTIIFFSKLNAQTSWLVTGNSNITTSNFIGTTNTKPLIIKTNKKERLRILSNGNIGIGTRTPDNTLHVFKGSAGSVTGWPYAPLVVENSAQCYINLLAPDNLETGIFFGKPESNISGGIIYNNTISGANSFQFRTGGNQIRMIIDAGGHIGVNTLTPDGSYALTVNSFENGAGGIFSSGLIGIQGSGVDQGVYGAGYIGVEGYSTNSDGYAGYFAGNVFSEGSYQGSDQKLKQNIRGFSNAMNIINQLKPKQYEFRQDGYYRLMNLPESSHYGLIAQEVETVLPSLIKETKFDPAMAEQRKSGEKIITKESAKAGVINFKALNYTELIPIMIKGMQELSKMNNEKDSAITAMKDDYDAKISELQNQVDELKALIVSSQSNVVNQQSGIISSAYLEQNIPNPFTNTTTINYNLPEKFSSAQIVITDKSGKTLKQVNISGSGKGTLNVGASSLALGAYQYSLYVDGKLIATKQMVLTK